MTEKFIKVPQDLLHRTDLTSTAKLVYGVVVDRMGQNSNSWPGMRRIALDIGMTVPPVMKAVDDLERVGLLVIDRRKGPHGGHRYSLPSGKGSVALKEPQRSKSDMSSAQDSITGPIKKLAHNQTKEPNQGTRPNITSLGSQTRKSQKHRPAQFTEGQVERIYQAYPRKVARAEALKAISKALERVAKRPEEDAAAWLLAKVQAYAKSRANQDPSFTPYPATWFSGDRYDDDPVEWSQRDQYEKHVQQQRSRVAAPPDKYRGVSTRC